VLSRGEPLCKSTVIFIAFFLVFLRFSTRIHYFAQIFSAIYVDAIKGAIYLAHRLNRKQTQLNGSAQQRGF
jgi:hypothetical protein